VLALVEIWNRFDDLRGAARTLDRKISEATAFAPLVDGGERPYRVAACWALVDTAANRAVAKRYPEVLRARFPKGWREWVTALSRCGPIPENPGILWVDPRSGRLAELRLPTRFGS
jgi:hypothetical protein